MKKVLYIIIMFLILSAGAVGYYFITQGGEPTSGEPRVNPFGNLENITNWFTGSSSSTSTPGEGRNGPEERPLITITDANKKSITVRDFLATSTVTTTILAGAAIDQENPGYQIVYYRPDSSFVISLFAEPLGAKRKEAEVVLLELLGIAEAQVCKLRHFVATPEEVSTFYAGRNLGFSFCPGATTLP